ncbi:ribosome-assembly protein 3-domain-containing protein [Hypoxylon crocopeplum]|nr:ribosome-assembly protein 3-domain-containing protein [Hypoxylon crocopeplum]
MSKKDTTSQEFTSYYLQQSTKEFAEDLDKIRSADDFKGDAVAMLVKSLQQGTSLFSATDQKRIIEARKSEDSEKERTHRVNSREGFETKP